MNWKTLGVPEELYAAMQEMVPRYAVSVSEYARLWIAIGLRLDRASNAAPELAKILDVVRQALQEDKK